MGRSLLVLGALGVALALLPATPSGQAGPQQPVFRTGVDYVTLDAVVTDKNDKPVTNLNKDDFEVTEHGRVQPIQDFQFVSLSIVQRPVTDVRTSAPSVDVVSNAHAPTARQWVLVIDDLHIIESHIQQTKTVVEDFLRDLPQGDQVAIVFVGRSDLSQDFTSDLGAQLRTVNRIRGALGLAYDAADHIQAGSSEDPLAADAASRERRRYAGSTLDVVRNVCEAIARSSYPRKALVYVSEGMTYSLDQSFYSDYLDFSQGVNDARDFFEELHAALKIAEQAGVPVYPIDPRGVPDCTAVRGDCTDPPWQKIYAQWNNLRTLAENTGGLAFVNRPILAEAVHELVADNSSYYLLGYYPQPFDRDGKFHDVTVSVKRPGLRVRARQGYTASKAVVTTTTDAQQALTAALGAALPTDGLTLRAVASPIAPSANGMRTAITVEVTYPQPIPPRLDDTLQFGVVAIDHDGKLKAQTRRAFHFTATPKPGTGVTYAIDETMDLPAQPLTLRIGVASQALDRAGTIHVPVEPIDPAHNDLQLSAVAIGFDGPAREAFVPPGRFEQLVPFQPTTTRTFAPADTLHVFARAFWAGKEPPPQAVVSVTDEPSSSPRPAAVTSLPAAGNHRQATLEATLPLGGLTPGTHTLAVTARLAGGHTATRNIAFEVK